MNDIIYIGVAEDHSLVRKGLVYLLNDLSDIQVVFEANNGKELLQKLKEFGAEIVLLDIQMPVLSGISAMEKIRQRFPKVKIIVVSAHSEPTAIIDYVTLGASAFISKSSDLDVLVAAIRGVHQHGIYFDDEVSQLLVRNGILLPGFSPSDKHLRELTEREITILRLICSNKPYKQIAEIMGLNQGTIDWYKHKLLMKTHTRNLQDLLAYAIAHKLMSENSPATHDPSNPTPS